MKRVALEEFRKNAKSFVTRCRRLREPIAIMQFGEEVARLVPRKRSLGERIRGAFGIAHGRGENTRKYASWGVFLKMR